MDSSSESEETECPEDASMLAFKDDENMFDGMFTFMVKSDDEEDEENINLFDIKQNLNVDSIRRFRNLDDVLIDSVIELTKEKGLYEQQSAQILLRKDSIDRSHAYHRGTTGSSRDGKF